MKTDKFLILNSIIVSFIIIFLLNVFLFPEYVADINSLLHWDIEKATMDINFFNISKVFLIFLLETWILTSFFYLISKRFI